MLNRYAAYFLGPELAWGLVLALVALLVSRNKPPTEARNRQLEATGYFLPLLGLTLAFLSFAWAPGNQWIWLLRIALVSAVGVFIVTNVLCGGINYHDSRNSGVGTGFILLIGLGYLELLIGVAVAAFFIATTYSFIAFLKWMGIVFAGLVCLWSLLSWLASFGEKKLP